MRRSLAIALVAACTILGSGDRTSTEAFLHPSLPSQRVSFQAANKGLQAKPDSLYSLKKDGRSIFSIARRQGKDSRQVEGSRPRKVRRSVGMLLSVAFFWFGAAGLKTNPSHASTEVAPISKSTNIFSASLDKMVDGYVKNHMFDDDVYEPVESVYREAVNDKLEGSYPKALSKVASSVLGQDGVKAVKQKSETGIGGLLLNGITFLKRRAGLSETAAIMVLTGSFVVAGPLAFAFVSMMVAGQSKRQINSVMKKRYGDTYTVDASIKVEDDVELPDEDEEGDDDEEDDDDDDDSDEE
eukprot:CAMPEP_0117000426 /NCGR_PEP_ID=MMETSP0472-20121206/2770_1 /TAXON_ID=693140 ORGANISM="Tiarina fusus, Strain LIS" /NCGR_SAMPLE_ID=MMETSP0472 /ASSEMBLY_ACC=CAM_ASM_000603 /LENGTH=297 /DNA_ID=CAMNT_0004700111 /DNA_START=98 /DNA_END=991 /DNA_ORIENTATION=-